jgi:hypothetical protein
MEGEKTMKLKKEILKKMCGAALFCFLLSFPAFTAQQIVTTELDSVPGSLRSSINSAPVGDTIVFNMQNSSTVYLKNQIVLQKDIVINGASPDSNAKIGIQVVSPGTSPYRIFSIRGGSVLLKGLILVGGSIDSGGVISCAGSNTTVKIDKTTIRGGRITARSFVHAIYGAGICNIDSKLIITNSSITGNTAYYYFIGSQDFQRLCGAGIFNQHGTLEIENSQIDKNIITTTDTANPSGTTEGMFGYGGGICSINGSLTLKKCVVENNSISTSRAYGGGIFNDSGNLDISSCIIDANYCSGDDRISSYAEGGGLYNNAGILQILNSTINGNKTRGHFSRGGGTYISDAVSTMINCTFHGDSAQGTYSSSQAYGGGLYVMGGRLNVVYCTILKNACYSQYSCNADNGGIECQFAKCNVINSIVVGNSSYGCGSLKASDVWIPDSTSRAINCLFGARAIVEKQNCDTNVTIQQILGSDSLKNNGGMTPTVAINSLSSLAVGFALRTGTYENDTVINNVHFPYANPAYFDPVNSCWLSADHDSVVPSGRISEITTDQRGIVRSVQPCAGAFELPHPVTTSQGKNQNALNQIWVFFGRKNAVLHIPFQETACFELFSLNGRKIVSRSVKGLKGKSMVAIPDIGNGAFIYCISSPHGVVAGRIIKKY